MWGNESGEEVCLDSMCVAAASMACLGFLLLLLVAAMEDGCMCIVNFGRTV